MTGRKSVQKQARLSPAKFAKTLETLAHGEEAARRNAAKKLGRWGDPAAVAALCRALQDSDRFVRRRAAISLGSLGDGEAFDPLCQALQDKSQGVRRATVGALGRLGDVRAVAFLLPFFNHSDLRFDVVEAFLSLGAPGIQNLCGLDANDVRLRSQTQTALRQLANYRTPKALFVVLADSRLGANDRHACLEALLSRISTLHLLSRHLTSVQKFCEHAQRSDNPAVRDGARVVLEYLTLGRAGQADPGKQKGELLRAAHNTSTPEGASSLLRASSDAVTPFVHPQPLIARCFSWCLALLHRLMRRP